MEPWQHHTVTRNGINLATRRRGDPAKPAVLFVHGYPDNSDVWDRLTDLLADDYHLMAYDVRGAGASSAPSGLAAYRLDQLRDDLFAVIDALSPGRPVHLVAHDWGSIQSWEAVTEPDAATRIASYTSLSGPCLDHVGLSLRGAAAGDLAGSLKQALKSGYIAAFHVPLLAPAAWKLGLAKAWPGFLERTERIRVSPSPTQSRDGAQGIALYRANMVPRLLRPRRRRARIPVQLLVALRDRYVGPDLAALAESWADSLQRHDLDTGHWGPLLGQPEITATHLRAFINEQEALAQGDPR